MSDQLTTTASVAVSTLISSRTTYYIDKVAVFDKLIDPIYKIEVPYGQNAVNVPQQDSLTFVDVPEAAGYDSETFTTVDHTLTPDTLGCNVVESWETMQGTPIDTVEMYAEAGGTAYVHALESLATYSYAAMYANIEASSPDMWDGTDGVNMTASMIRVAAYKLMAQGARGQYNLVVDPIQFNHLMADAEFRAHAVRDLTAPHGYAATVGVSLDRYLGQIYGVHVWVGNGMIESSGLHAIMFGKGAFGRGYKKWFTPSNPTPAELHVSKTWDDKIGAHRIWFRSCFHIDVLAGPDTSSCNFAAVLLT